MKYFAHSQGQFSGWKGDEVRRKALFRALISGIVFAKPRPVGTIVSLEDFRSLSERQQSAFKDPYYIAFQRCTRGAAVVGFDPLSVEQDKVAMVYSYNREFGAVQPHEVYSVDQAGLAEQLWHTMKKHTDYGTRMGSYASSTPGELAPLQAADLFAYELAKEFQNLRTRPNDGMRWGLRQILRISGHPYSLISLLDRLELLRIIKESQWPCQEHTEEVEDVVLQMNSARERTNRWMLNRGGVGEPDIEIPEL